MQLLAGERVLEVEARGDGYRVRTSRGEHAVARVVLATGGLSLPKTGSDGAGLEIARAFGHSVVPTTPALVPLVLGGSFHTPLSGVSHEVELVVPRRQDREAIPSHGLAAVDPLRRERARGAGRVASLPAGRRSRAARRCSKPICSRAGTSPGSSGSWCGSAAEAPRTSVARALSRQLPQAVAQAVAADAGCGETTLGRLTREERRTLVRGIVERRLPVAGSRGYSFAEVTAGGVPLAEVDTATMQSRLRPGLHLVGEMLDVDGRIGGFNFQWAWSSGWVAAGGLARPL